MKAVETARHNEPWRIEFNTLREMKEEQKADDDEYYGKIIEQKNAELDRKDKTLSRQAAELDKKDAELDKKDKTLSQQAAELERLRAENAVLKAQNRRG